MNTAKKHVAVAAALVTLWLSGVQAHHGLATFATTKTATIEGTVTTWEWANPHVYLYVDVVGPEGVANWRVEFGSVGNLRVRGFSRTSFKAGDKVRVTGSPRADGFKEVLFRQGWFGSGEPFPGQQPGPPPQTPAPVR